MRRMLTDPSTRWQGHRPAMDLGGTWPSSNTLKPAPCALRRSRGREWATGLGPGQAGGRASSTYQLRASTVFPSLRHVTHERPVLPALASTGARHICPRLLSGLGKARPGVGRQAPLGATARG